MTTARYYGGGALREYLLSVYRGGFRRPLVKGREVAVKSFLSNEDLTACDTIRNEAIFVRLPFPGGSNFQS